MKTKKEPKTKASELEIIDDIFMVKKENKKLVGLKCDESNTGGNRNYRAGYICI